MSIRQPAAPTVVIGLCNGAAHLDAQLQSLRAQTLQPEAIIASDDGSTDGTAAIFEAFARSWPEVPMWLMAGPQGGSTANFIALLRAVPAETAAVALCDQDDVWLPDRLALAADALHPFADRPALYGARSWETDGNLANPRLSRRMPPPWGFAHALTQNFAGGNTMMLNAKALALVQDCPTSMPMPVVHDWWLYQIVSGAGGLIVFDDRPVLFYRQHSSNQIGAASGLQAKVQRAKALMRGTYREWNNRNIACLSACRALLTPDAASILADFASHRQAALLPRTAMLRRAGLHRKGALGQASLWGAALLGKL